MKRRKFVQWAGGAALVRTCSPFAAATLVPRIALAQSKERIFRLGFLGSAGERDYANLLATLRAGLRELGYVEGKNIAIEHKFAAGKSERLAALAAELVQQKVDLILAHGTPATQAAQQETATIPIVMVGVGDPVGAGFVSNLARPGGNITGLSVIDADLASKRMQLLKEILPKLSLLAVLRNPTNASGGLQLRETQAAASSQGIRLHLVHARNPVELEGAFAEIGKMRADALSVLADPMFLSERKRIADLATRNRLPSIFAREENADAGGLMSYGPTLDDAFRQAGAYVDKILKGRNPGDLPVEEPKKVYLVINLRAARALGLAIPQSLALRADRLVQ